MSLSVHEFIYYPASFTKIFKSPQTIRMKENMHEDNRSRDFPGGPVAKNLLSNAGDTGSIPGQGAKIPRAVGQLGPRVATREPIHHK